jgi:SNF2 family DNA or RNA helicase
MDFPLGLGVEFVGCDDLRPQRIATVPRPRIHIKAAHPNSDVLEAIVHFDYGGTLVRINQTAVELYDKNQSVIIEVDRAFHESSVDLLVSLGCKMSQQRYGNGADFSIHKRKLPALVAQLIHRNWHVEADGKLYRTASKFDLSVVSGIDWFELQGKAHFDQTTIDLPAILQALRAGERSVVLDDGTLGVIPEAWIKQFSNVARLADTDGGAVKFGRSQVGLLDVLLAEQGAVNVDEKFNAARNSLRNFDRIEPREAPSGFVGTLRPYQQLALGWFEFLRTLGFGGCLADDMGLGKTVQVLALLEQRRQLKSGPSLIVLPRSLIFNWTAEANKFAPKLRVLDQSHSQRLRGTEHLLDYDLVLTTYGTLRRDAAFLKDFEFDYVILDEAQAIKNSTTEAAKAARLLNGRHKLALSGTPIENHLGELWSLFDFLNPGMLGRVGRFANLASDADRDERQLLAAAVRPFILRRTKKQVAPELPDRIEQTVVVQLDPDQRKAYDELREFYRQSLIKKIETDGIGKSQIVILEALLRLRQAACHPGLIDKARATEPSAKLDELLTRLTSAIETGERVLVFSQFTSFLAIVKARLKQAKIAFLYLDGKTKNRQELVEQFQSGTGPSIFLISLKAGGVGLNLTAARSVYLLDPWWNPAVEAQAIDRSHRIGQQQVVFATRLIAADTVEQKVLELQARKKGLADAIVNADNKGISSLTKEDLELLLA